MSARSHEPPQLPVPYARRQAIGACGIRPRQRRQAPSGVTLIELLVTLSIATILLTLGVSGLTQVVAENKRASEVNQLAGTLNYARTEAIYRASVVSVCPIDPDNLPAEPRNPCNTSRAHDGEVQWAQGYIVYVRDTGERLRIQSPSNGVTIESGGRTKISFQDDGSAGGSNATFKVCDGRDESEDDDGRAEGVVQPRTVIVSASGRVRVAEYMNGGGEIDCSSAPAREESAGEEAPVPAPAQPS